ncbi:MAG: hypothetical protein AB8G17_08400 [Gammaproteobacteria bacterium]
MALWGLYGLIAGSGEIIAVAARDFTGAYGIYEASIALQLSAVFSVIDWLAFCLVGLAVALRFRNVRLVIALAVVALVFRGAWSYFLVWPYLLETWNVPRPMGLQHIFDGITLAVYLWLFSCFTWQDSGAMSELVS